MSKNQNDFFFTNNDRYSILSKINITSQASDTTTQNKYTTKSEFGLSFRDLFTFMLEKEFRNEDPSGKIIAFMLLIVSLIGGGAFAVKLGLQGIPPLKMALLRCILGLIAVGGLGLCLGMSMRLRFEEFRRLLLIAALYTLHTITLNIGTQLTTASRSTIFFSLYPFFTVLFGHFWLPNDRLTVTKTVGSHRILWGVSRHRAKSTRSFYRISHRRSHRTPQCRFLGTSYYVDKGVCSRDPPLSTPCLALRFKHPLLLHPGPHL